MERGRKKKGSGEVVRLREAGDEKTTRTDAHGLQSIGDSS